MNDLLLVIFQTHFTPYVIDPLQISQHCESLLIDILSTPHCTRVPDPPKSASFLGPCLFQLKTPHWLLIVFSSGFQPLNSVLDIGCVVESLGKLWKILMPGSPQASPSPRDPEIGLVIRILICNQG